MRQAGRATAVVLALAVTAGCAAVTQKPLPLGVTVPQGWQQAAEAPGTAAAAGAGDLAQWWGQFGDATLSGLVATALESNHDLRTAATRLRDARARRGLAAKDLLPSVTVSATASTSKTTGGQAESPARGLFDAGFDASWEPDVFGGTRQAVNAAQADLEASEADLRATRVSLVAELALNYIELRGYRARLGIARDNLAQQEETLQLTTWRARAGLVSDLDVQQARTNVEQTRAAIPALETAAAAAEHRLAVLTGQPPAALHTRLADTAPIPSLPDRVLVAIPADTLRQRPDVLAAERRLAAETARLGQAEAARYPSIRLSGSLGLQTVTGGGLGAVESFSRSLLAGLTAPIFDRGRIRQQIEIQSAAQERALIAVEQAVLTALEEVENALVGLDNARRRLAALTSAAEAARSAADMARSRYTAGLVSYQTVLDTERSRLSAEDNVKATEADGASALVRLYKALGGGWTKEAAPTAGTHPESEAS